MLAYEEPKETEAVVQPAEEEIDINGQPLEETKESSGNGFLFFVIAVIFVSVIGVGLLVKKRQKKEEK